MINTTTTTKTSTPDIDQGLRSYMLSVYNNMFLALALTGLTSSIVAGSPQLIELVFNSSFKWVVMLAPFAFILAMSFGLNKMKLGTLHLLFWSFSIVMGMSLSATFLAYTGESLARVFFITAGTFAAMSIYGYTTNRDLSKYGSLLIMGLFGLIIAMIVNIFLVSNAMHFVISVVGVMIFVAFTAYDTQKIKLIYSSSENSDTLSKKAIMGSLSLYLDFVNLFVMLLSFLGDRK